MYYAGTEKQWNAIWVQEGNDIFSQAEIHYNYKWTLRPVTAKAEYIASSGKPYIKWEAVTGAVKYEVYRAGSKRTPISSWHHRKAELHRQDRLRRLHLFL